MMWRLPQRVFVVLVGLSALVVVGSVYLGFREIHILETSRPSSIRLQALSAHEIRELIQGSASRVTWVNVWATWCQPCTEEFPLLLELRKKYPPKDLHLVLINADFKSSLDDAKAFLKRSGVDFLTYSKSETDQKFIDALSPNWQGSLPANVFFGIGGKQIDFWEGARSHDEIRDRLSKAISGSFIRTKGSIK